MLIYKFIKQEINPNSAVLKNSSWSTQTNYCYYLFTQSEISAYVKKSKYANLTVLEAEFEIWEKYK